VAALVRVERFAEDGDLHLVRAVAAEGWRLDAGVGLRTGRGFVTLRGGTWRALVWLGPARPGRTQVDEADAGVLWARRRSVVVQAGVKR
jgi:hypothetical protein